MIEKDQKQNGIAYLNSEVNQKIIQDKNEQIKSIELVSPNGHTPNNLALDMKPSGDQQVFEVDIKN